MIRTVLLATLALSALAAPALAFEVQQAPAPHATASNLTDMRGIARLMPQTASEAFRFGPSARAPAKDAKVVYELKAGKPAEQIDVTDPRDNPFMPQPERPSVTAH